MNQNEKEQEFAWFGESKASDEKMARDLAHQLDMKDYVDTQRQEQKDAEFARSLNEADSGFVAQDEAVAAALCLSEQEVPKNSDTLPSDRFKCFTCKKPFHTFGTRTVEACQRTYHKSCFLCIACQAPLGKTFAVDNNNNPIHSDCYSTLYMPTCVVCKSSLANSSTRVLDRNARSLSQSYTYARHPFFDWKYCSKHENSSLRCSSCNRVEPNDAPFNKIDESRVICLACVRSVILDSDELQPLFLSVLDFLDQLDVCVFPEMRSIPVLSVGAAALNDAQNSSHSQCRGLCLSEKSTSSFSVPVIKRRGIGGFVEEMSSRFVPGQTTSSVTAILILSGLPRTLTASILAHECVHAWFKLHPQFNNIDIDKQSEEGVCQLVAYLYLKKQLEINSSAPAEASEIHPTDQQLSQFYKFSLENDRSPVYGDGFRLAFKAYTALGNSLPVLLNLTNSDGRLPPC